MDGSNACKVGLALNTKIMHTLLVGVATEQWLRCNPRSFCGAVWQEAYLSLRNLLPSQGPAPQSVLGFFFGSDRQSALANILGREYSEQAALPKDQR